MRPRRCSAISRRLVLSYPPPYVLLLSLAIILTYIVALWRLLRNESHSVLLVLLLVVSLASALWAYDFPPLHADEGLTLECSADDYEAGRLFDDNCNKLPSLIHMLFELPLVHVFGPGVVAIRAYSFLGTAASLAVIFALIRIMGGTVVAGLWGAAILAIIPGNIFHARLYQGGELLLNQLLLLTVLATAIWRQVRPVDLWIGAVVCCLGFYTYFSSRSMTLVPLVAFVLARGWRNRAACLLVLALGFAGALPLFLSENELRWTGLKWFGALATEATDATQDRYWPLVLRFDAALSSTWAATGNSHWLSTASGGMHPVVVLLLAIGGLWSGLRASLFMAAVLVAGLTPAVFGYGEGTSTHRLTLAYAILPVAAALGLDLFRRFPRAHLFLAVGTLTVAAYQALGLYFGTYQQEMAQWYDPVRTRVARDFPSDKPIFYTDMRAFAEPRRLDLGSDRVRPLMLSNLMRDDVYHVVCIAKAPLSFYLDLVGAGNIVDYGYCFRAYLPAGVWGERKHGWHYTIHCDDDLVDSGIVPTSFHAYTFRDTTPCPEPKQRIFHWDARWVGAPATIEVTAPGPGDLAATIDGVRKVAKPGTATAFPVAPGSELRLSMQELGDLRAEIWVVEPEKERRLVYWSETEPIQPGGDRLATAMDLHEP